MQRETTHKNSYNSPEDMSQEEIEFRRKLNEFFDNHGSQRFANLKKTSFVDTYQLYRSVIELGGFKKVCAEKKWDLLSENLGIGSAKGHYRLYKFYKNYLLEFEYITFWGLSQREAVLCSLNFARSKTFKRKREESGEEVTSFNNKPTCSWDRFTKSPTTIEDFERCILQHTGNSVAPKLIIVNQTVIEPFDLWQIALNIDVTFYKGWKWVTSSLCQADDFHSVCTLRNHYVGSMMKLRNAFSTSDKHKVLRLNKLQENRTPEEYILFEKELTEFVKGRELWYPLVDGSFLDPLILFTEVHSRGGIILLEKKRKWKEVAKKMGFIDLSNSKKIKKFYEDYLIRFYPSMFSFSPDEKDSLEIICYQQAVKGRKLK